MPDDAEQLRGRLRDIGNRRAKLAEIADRLARETTKAVEEARGVLTVSEVAVLLGIDRTGVYRTYTKRTA